MIEDFYDMPLAEEYIVEDNSPLFVENAREEVEEECGSIPRYSIIDEYIYEDCGWKYKTFIAAIDLDEKKRWQPQPSEGSAWEVMQNPDGTPSMGWFNASQFKSLDLFFGFTPQLIQKVANVI